MAEPVFFLEPKFETEPQRVHREKISILHPDDFKVYRKYLTQLHESGKLLDPWKMKQVEAEARSRYGRS